MPTILREGPFRFYFYAGDRDEPPHVHVERDNRVAKFWLDPVRLERGGGLRATELRRIEQIIEDNQTRFLREWHDRFER